MSMSLAVMCGGLATRLFPVTKTIPKSLISIAGEPFIAHQLRLFKRNNIENIVLCCGYLSQQIEEFVGDGRKFGLSVSYSFDGDKQLGTGGALKKALPMLSDDFMVVYGDSYLMIDYQEIAAFYTNSKCKTLMTVFKNNGQWDASNIVFNNGQIVCYDKKKSEQDQTLPYEYIDYGLGIVNAELIASWPEESFDLSNFYRHQVDAKRICGYEVSKRFYEIGSKQGITETEQFLKAMNHGE